MQSLDDLALLRKYAANNSEAAFAELVARRVGFVYSAALRQVRDPHLAEEITQAVFIILAQKAGKISDKTILAGWLFKTTRYAAIAHAREAAKRSRRTATIEQEMQMQTELSTAAPDPLWEQMSPLLDEALASLGETDRQAVLLRFFENQSLAEVGRQLGTGEDTARKRVSRALEKLHRYFNKRGVSSTTAIIAGVLTTNSVHAAPVALAKSVTAVALAKGAAAGGSTLALAKGVLKIMAWTKAKTAVAVGAGILLAASTTTVVLQETNAFGVPDKYFLNLEGRLYKLPPYLVIRKTHFKNHHDRDGETTASGNQDRAVGRNMDLLQIIEFAYGFHDRTRTVLPAGLPEGKFDFMTTVPNALPKLQAEIKKQFGYMAHLEKHERPVLALRFVRESRNLPLAKPGFMSFADWLQHYFGRTVVDQTGGAALSAEITEQLHWDSMVPPDEGQPKLRQALRDQLGLELAETNIPIEMLVVEKVEN